MHIAPLHALITRPMPDAEKTAAILSQHGIACMIEPMLAIQEHAGLAAAWQKATCNPVQAVLITSANAVRLLSALTKRRDIPLVTVGDSSAEVAREHGFTNVRSASGDVNELATLVIKDYSPKKGAMLYVKGTVSAGNLDTVLAEKGFTVIPIIGYDAVAPTELSYPLHTALIQGTLDIALFYSPRTALIFEDLICREQITHTVQHMQAFCLSPMVADSFKRLKWGRIHIAKYPNSESLLELIANFKLTKRTA